MRIALRTSGGRGEYELAGRQASIASSDLFGLNLQFQLAPDLTINSRSAAHLTQGKPRIRLDDARTDQHAYRVFAGALLLPPPRRELRLASDDDDFIRDKRFVISDIDVDVVSRSASDVWLRPTKLYLSNASGLVRSVVVAERMALVFAIWEAARTEAGTLADLVRVHELAVHAGEHVDIARAGTALREYFATDGDILPELTARFDAATANVGVRPDDAVSDDGAEDETDPDDARRREITAWRRQVARTAAGRRFALSVRSLYSDRCAVSGTRLPSLASTGSPGVDAAHILPWAKYDLNSVTNGICLNKLCHWGFDAGVIRLDFSEEDDQYVVSIPDIVAQQSAQAEAELNYFEQFVGPIANDRLPSDRALRPSPQYLARLNREMYP